MLSCAPHPLLNILSWENRYLRIGWLLHASDNRRATQVLKVSLTLFQVTGDTKSQFLSRSLNGRAAALRLSCYLRDALNGVVDTYLPEDLSSPQTHLPKLSRPLECGLQCKATTCSACSSGMLVDRFSAIPSVLPGGGENVLDNRRCEAACSRPVIYGTNRCRIVRAHISLTCC